MYPNFGQKLSMKNNTDVLLTERDSKPLVKIRVFRDQDTYTGHIKRGKMLERPRRETEVTNFKVLHT